MYIALFSSGLEKCDEHLAMVPSYQYLMKCFKLGELGQSLLTVKSRIWLSTAILVIFPRLVKYTTNLSIISFQDADLASPKLSVTLFKIIV